MKQFRSFYIAALAVVGVGLIGTSFVPKAHADGWDKKTIVTVNELIIAGNKVLNPGTYVWKLLDSQSDRHIVQIFDRDQRHLEQTILAMPNYRLQPSGNSQFSFWETPAGVPKAVRAWFYPGDNFGQEFPYPKKLVAQLASARPTPIPTHYNPPMADSNPQPAPAAAPTPTPEPAAQPQAAPEVAQNTAPELSVSAQAEPAPPAEPTALPKTASYGPLIGLMGVFSIGLA